MTITDWIHVIAGTFIMISVLLAVFVSNYWLIFTAFVGLNLFQFGFTKFCPMAILLKKLGVPAASSNG